MRKALLLTVALSSLLIAKSELDTCVKCHPAIVEEFKGSMHKNSSFHGDEIHKAVWDKHPAKAKGNYDCAGCHAPNAKSEEEVKEGITCTTCHTIKDVEEHASVNKNIYGKDLKKLYSAEAGREDQKVIYKQESSWFGMNKTTVGSPYHDIDYTNEKYYTGQICMGCHSHRENSHEFMLCETGKDGAKDKEQNCITCHMPKVQGSATTIRHSEKHSFHGFAGARKHPEMLSQHVELEFKKTQNGFDVVVENKAPHNFMLHPLRVAQLKVNLIRDAKSTPLKTETFVKVIGNDEGPSMPWLATKVVEDTMLKANEKRSISYSDTLKKGDRLEVQLGYFVVNPKALKNLGLEENKELEKFKVLKQKIFNIE